MSVSLFSCEKCLKNDRKIMQIYKLNKMGKKKVVFLDMTLYNDIIR